MPNKYAIGSDATLASGRRIPATVWLLWMFAFGLVFYSADRFPSDLQSAWSFEKAKQLQNDHEFQRAIGLYKSVLTKQPTSHRARARLAICEFRVGDFENCLTVAKDVDTRQIDKPTFDELANVVASAEKQSNLTHSD